MCPCYAYMYVCSCVCESVCLHMCMCVSLCVSVCMCAYICDLVCPCVYVCTSVYWFSSWLMNQISSLCYPARLCGHRCIGHYSSLSICFGMVLFPMHYGAFPSYPDLHKAMPALGTFLLHHGLAKGYLQNGPILEMDKSNLSLFTPVLSPMPSLTILDPSLVDTNEFLAAYFFCFLANSKGLVLMSFNDFYADCSERCSDGKEAGCTKDAL